MTLRCVLATTLLLLVLAVAALAAFVWSGRYAIGADAPHATATRALIDTLRDRATERAARGVAVPALDDPRRIADGARHYAAMCSGCHLAPGRTQSQLRAGLSPQPPDLTQEGIDNPAEAFWIIKHGIKLTAMPAWGKSEDDDDLWALVAFTRQLPGMSPERYAQLSGGAPDADDASHGHH